MTNQTITNELREQLIKELIENKYITEEISEKEGEPGYFIHLENFTEEELVKLRNILLKYKDITKDVI